MRRDTLRPRRARVLLFGALLGLLVAGCEGDNLFSGGGGNNGGGTEPPPSGGTPPAADTVAPRLTFLQPADSSTYTRGEPIRVRVQVRDSASGFTSLKLRGISFRGYGDTLSNVSAVVKYPEHAVTFPQGPQQRLPLDTVIVRDLQPGSDTVSEPVWVIAEASDSAGNVAVDTIFLRPGPRIEILEPAGGDRPGGAMRLHVRAIDPVVGLSSVRIELSGSVNHTIVRGTLNGVREAVVVDTMITLPPTAGSVTVRATVVNRDELSVSAGPVNVTFTAQSASDTLPPLVERELFTHAIGSDRQLRDRVELGDTLRVFVRADDGNGSGISEIGAVIRIQPDSMPELTLVRQTTFATPQPGVVQDTFIIVLKDLYSEQGPFTTYARRFAFEVHGYAFDGQAGTRNCAASVQETPESRQCAVVPGGGQQAAGLTGQRYVTHVVPGTSLRLPAGSVIADMLPDTTAGRQRIFLSNFSRNRVEVLALADSTFRSPVLVGSQPWGMFLVPGGSVDTLMVANSGGTSISFVPTDVLREDAPKRLLTPNDALFEIEEKNVNGFIRYAINKLEFSDRPQFVAQDRNKVILYSTEPTSAAEEGTIRLAQSDPTPSIPNDVVRPEVKLIFGREAIDGASGETYAVARVDSMFVRFSNTGDDQVEVCDHRPGRPAEAFCRIGYAYDVLELMGAMPEDSSDVFFDRGTWNREIVGFSDTTYVAYSKDLSTIAFGEGAAAPFGRVVLYNASPVSGEEGSVASQGTADLISNAAEVVMGVALNVDGSFGVARGMGAAYFFSNNAKLEGPLRLQGMFADTISAGNGGVVLHPHHGSITGGSTPTTLAFIATSGRSIRIIDTFHYFEVGEIPVRENVTGQLRAAPPLPGVNAGLTPDRCEYTVAHLYGVSDEGASGMPSDKRILMLNVRVKHLSRYPGGSSCTP